MKSSLLKRVLRSSSSPQEPRISEPPEEKGLIAEDCAPMTVHANSAVADSPVDAARPGIRGNSAGATTPVVELKKLMIAPTILKAIGTRKVGTFAPIQLDSA